MNPSLLIGIDFGTTYSGVAWAWSGSPELIHIVARWQSHMSNDSDQEKVPTTILYSENRRTLWGYDTPAGAEVLTWFKLLLAEGEDLQDDIRKLGHLEEVREALRMMGKSVVRVVADYLRLLWNHAIADIERTRGRMEVERLPFRVVLTVPAIWDHKAQSMMKEAATLAEPEAAALATLADFKDRPDVKIGETFVVCDAGGGTVDVISYQVMSTSPVVLKKRVDGKGKLCGGAFLDQGFQELIKERVGDDEWALYHPEDIEEMMHNDWEHKIKRLFDGSDRAWNVRLPEIPADLDNSQVQTLRKLQLQRDHIEEVFEHVIVDISSLVNEQVRLIKGDDGTGESPRYVILVGGFGRCNYLYKALVESNAPKGIEVLQSSGARPWTSVCRGAVIKAFSLQSSSRSKVPVASRIPRLNYTFVANERFEKKKNDSKDRLTCPKEEVQEARDLVNGFVRRGVVLKTEAPITFSYYRLFENRPLRKTST